MSRRIHTHLLVHSCIASFVFCMACGGDSGSNVARTGDLAPPRPATENAGPPRGRQQLSGHLTSGMSLAPFLEPVPASTALHLAMSLRARNRDDLKARLHGVAEPTDPLYRQYITPEQYAESYGPDAADYGALASWARSQGLVVERTFSNRLVVDLFGTADVVERAFHTSMSYRQRPDGTRFFMPDREPSIDSDVEVLHVHGLTDVSPPRPATCALLPTTTTGTLCLGGLGPDGGYIGSDLPNAYFGGTTCASLTGLNQSVGLVEYDGFAPQDIAAFQQATGLAATSVIRTPLEVLPPGVNASEVVLDIDMVWSMAPAVTINVYEGRSQLDILAAIATANPLDSQVSSSWFDGDFETAQEVLDELVLQGQSYFTAAGDGGRYTSRDSAIASAGALPPGSVQGSDFIILAASGVTVVGGTLLGVNQGAPPASYYEGEAAWNQSGGGFFGPNTDGEGAVPIPYYQQGISLHGAGFSSQYRNVPDVAMTAEMLSPYFAAAADAAGGAAVQSAQAGTSAAAPLWAAVMALVNEQNPSKPVGFANPILYALGKANAGYFNDITSTQTEDPDITTFTAAPGYDLVTGWGTPTCSLVTALATGTFERAPTTVLPSGFKTFGGQSNNLCLATAGDPVVAGAHLFSKTCNGSAAQNWVLSYGHGAISPAANTKLCIHGDAATGEVVLHACDGHTEETWTVGHNIVSAIGNGFRYCLDVSKGKRVSGERVDLTKCDATEAQTFWPWGFPLAMANAAGGQCLEDDGSSVLHDTVCRPNSGAPPRSEIFILTPDNHIVAMDSLTSADGTAQMASSACVNLDGLTGHSPSLSIQSCNVDFLGTSQSWFFTPSSVQDGPSPWMTVRSTVVATDGTVECIHVKGGSSHPGAQVDVRACDDAPAEAWQISPVLTDEIGFPGF